MAALFAHSRLETCRSTIQLALDNQEALEQLDAILAALEEGQYRERLAITGGQSVGGHVRHCLEFYQCFFAGWSRKYVDYARRPRDPQVETDCTTARRVLRQMVGQLKRFSAGEVVLFVVPEDAGKTNEDSTPLGSTTTRELEFLKSHTVHHCALIALLLRLQGVDPGASFGVAASTLRYRQQEAACAR